MDPILLLRAGALVLAGYLVGGIPWSVIVARLSGGPDPRTIGSGRTGGANTMRALGPGLALLSGLLDMLKGTAAVLLARAVGAGVEVEVLAGMASIVGHSRSPFLNFGGGRGVAPAFGALLAFVPLVALAIIPVFLGIIALTRYSSLGSLAGSAFGGVLFAVVIYVTPLDPWLYVYAVGGTALVWLFHWDNIGRLLRGEERRIGSARPEA